MNADRKKKREERKSAAALRYRQEEEYAPRLVAKGRGRIAENIIEAARDADVPLYHDPDMLALLMTLDIGEIIPPELYSAVAEVLAFIYRMNGRAAK